MRAVRFERFGEPAEVLAVQETQSPALTSGGALVRMLLRPINPSDLLTVRGRYGALPELPATPGREGVGVVEDLDGFQPGLTTGTRVVPINCLGTWQEEMVVPRERLVAVPDAVSDAAAAQAFINPLTVWAMLDELQMPAGTWLLQSAAASALGKLVIQMAKARGIRTVNVVRRREQADELIGLGADSVITWNVPSDRLAEQVREATGGQPVSYALDAVGGHLGGEMVNALSPGGVMLVHGSLAHPDPLPINSGRFLTRSLTLRGFWLNEWLERTPIEAQRLALGEILGQFAAGQLQAPPVEETYDLAAVREAVAHAGASRDGKIMLSG